MTDSPANTIVAQHDAETSQFSPDEAPVEATEEVVEEVAPQEEDAMSSRFAALARKEKMLQEREKEWKDKMDAEKQKYEELSGKYKGYDELDSNLNNDPLGWLEQKGYSYEKLTDLALGIKAEEAAYDPKSEIQKLRDELAKRDADAEEAKKKADEDKVNKANSASLDEYRVQIKSIIDDNSEKYELINLKEAHEDVLETAIQYYQTHGEVISAEQAADLVEKYYYEEAEKLLGLKKFSKKSEEEVKIEAKLPMESKPTVPRTLTSDNTAGNNPVKSSYANEEQSKKAAAALLKWD